jgi:hypothetical protein
MPKANPIPCDLQAALETINTIFGRHDALCLHLEKGLRNGMAAFDQVELGLSQLRASPGELEMALAAVVAQLLGRQKMEDFVGLLCIAGTVDFYEML